MNRQTKKEIRRLAVKVLVVVLALGLAFWGYAFVYRGKTEPPAKYLVTNQDAAVYSLRGQIQMLSQQEELNTFAFEGRKKEKEYGTSGNYNSYGGFGGFGGQSQSTYQDEEAIRRQAAANYIQSRHFQEAMNVLSSLSQRNGQWYYLSAMANMGLGNNVNAMNDARTAVNMEPDNMQYRMLLQRLEGGGSWYQEQQNPFGGMPSDGSDYCMKLCLANMVCNLCCPGSGMFCC